MKKFWKKETPVADSAESATAATTVPPPLAWCVKHQSALGSCSCQPGTDRPADEPATRTWVARPMLIPGEPFNRDRPVVEPADQPTPGRSETGRSTGRKTKKTGRGREEKPAGEPPAATSDRPDSTIDRLANMGWAGRRLARKRLHEQSDLELGDKRRAEIDKAHKAKADARRDRITNAAPSVVYLLAVAFAVGGQVTVFADWMELDWGQLAKPSISKAFLQVTTGIAIALGAAAFVEGAGLGFASATTKERKQGRPAHLTRIATWVCAFAACGINAAGHWDSVFAWPTALGSLVALLLWEMETHARCYKILTDTRNQLRREAAIRRLTRDCLQVSYPRTQVRQIMATLTIPQMEALVAEVIDPMKVARVAMQGFAALQHAAQEKPKGRLARLWAWLPFTGSGVKAAVPLMPVPQPRVDEDALQRMVDGYVPADAPVSPAPADDRPTDRKPADTDRPTTGRPADERPTGRPETGRKPADRPTGNRPETGRPTDRKPAGERPADRLPVFPTGPVDPAELIPADDRSADWMGQKLHQRFAAVWIECNGRPSGQQLADAAGGSKSQANAWKRENCPEPATTTS